MARPRQTEANHIRLAEGSSLWETQAEEAARRVARGEQDVARRLTPTPAASFKVYGSPGLPLRPYLREDLEAAFGADLSAVRLHVDAAAAAAAASANAQALTSGRDIYFASGAFQPGRASGYRLLAHELAHVLQQTGRLAPGGLLRATPAVGFGLPQMKGDGKAYRERLNFTFEIIEKAHLHDEPETELERMIKAVGDDLGRDFTDTVKAESLEKKVLNNDKAFKTKSSRARAFLLDVLKLTDRWKGAVFVAKQDLLTKTYVPVPALDDTGKPAGGFTLVQAMVQDQGYGWLHEVASKHFLLSYFWPIAFLDTIGSYAFGPTRAIPTLSVELTKPLKNDLGIEKLGNLEEAQKTFIEAWGKQTTPADNELVLVALASLVELDGIRLKQLDRISKEVEIFLGEKTPFRAIQRRYWIAVKVMNWGQSLKTANQFPGLSNLLGGWIEAIGKEASTFWEQVTETGLVSFSRETIKKAKAISPNLIARLAPAEATLTTGAPQAILKAMAALFKLEKDKSLPTAETYAAQVNTARDILYTYAQMKLELPLLQMLRAKKVDQNKALIYGWFIGHLLDLVQFLDSYSIKDDQEFSAKNKGLPDLRFAHRLRFAKRLQALVTLLGESAGETWLQVGEKIKPVLYNLEEGRSRLALLGDWIEKRDASILEIGDDFSQGLVEMPGVRGSAIAQLYLILYYQDLGARIDKLLAGAAAERAAPYESLKKEPLLLRARAAADLNSRPKKFILQDYEYAPNPAEKQKIEGTEVARDLAFLYLVENHPKTIAKVAEVKASLQAAGAQERDFLYPVNYRQGPFFWSVPKVDQVIALLRSDRIGLNRVIAEGKGKKVEEVKALSNEEYFNLFVELVDAGLLAAELVYENLQKVKGELEPKVRAAVTHERRLIAAVVKTEIAKYTGKVTEGGQYYQRPLEILELIERFARWVDPPQDREVQIAALFLTIASALRSALEGDERFFIITGYYGYLVLAINYAKEAKRKDLNRVMDAEEQKLIEPGMKDLQELRKAFDVVRSARQQRFGFQSEDGKNLLSLVYASAIEQNNAFQIDGDWYNLLQVHTKFKYHPAYGTKPLAESPEGEGGYSPPILFIDGKNAPVGDSAPGTKLFTILINGVKVEVTDKNEEMLTQLSFVIEKRANIIGLENLAELIESAAQLALDAAEFIPGAGQVIAVARIITSIVQFFASGEFQDIKALVTGDPQELLEEINNKLVKSLEPDMIWDFVLFGSPVFEFLKGKEPEGKKPARRIGGGKKSPLAKIVAGLRAIRSGISKALNAIYQRVQEPLHTFQTFIMARPLLAMAVRWVADHIFVIVEYITKAANVVQDVRKGFDDAKAGFQERLQALLDGLGGLTLPKEVIPLGAAVQAILTLILNRFGTKGRAVRKLLELTGKFDDVSEMIADELRSTGVNPNKDWKEKVLPLFEDKFVEARNAVIDTVSDILVNKLGLKLTLPKKAEKGDIPVKLEGEGFALEEEEALMEGYGAAISAPQAAAFLPAPAGGQPLDVQVRARAELNLGHDFSHVRLHQGIEAERAVGLAGAQALTSGSHIYLRPGHSPRAGFGRQILHHELAHVIQQTGPRPLGRSYDSRPRPGQPGRGLQVNPAHEAAAEKAAQTAGGGSSFQAGSAPEGGFQPAVFSIISFRRLLNKLSNLETAIEARRVIEERAELHKGQADVPPSELKIANDIFDSVWETLVKMDASILPSFPAIAKVSDPLKAYLTGQRQYITPVLPFIAQAALVSKPKLPGTPKGALAEKELNVGRFASHLQEFITALTGVVVTIDVRRRAKGGGVPSKGWVEDVKITNILMFTIPYAGNATRIWDAALRPFPTTGNPERRRALLRGALRSAGNTFLVVTSEDVSGATDRVKIWDENEFKFHTELVAFIKRQESYIEGVVTAPDYYKEYIAYSRKERHKVVGVRVGVYIEKTQEGPNRESHHTTQWVLAEYFRGETAQKPFPLVYKATWEALGVEFDGTGPVLFGRGDKALEVNIQGLAAGEHGDDMPTILLSKLTHRTGDLHIKGATPDDLGEKKAIRRPTQSGTLHNKFQSELFSGVLSGWRTGKKPEEFDAYVEDKVPQVQAQIHAAMMSTYQSMYHQMMPALERALPSLEVGYYRTIANIQDGKEEKPDLKREKMEEAMGPVYTAAEKNNNEVMRSFGFKESGT